MPASTVHFAMVAGRVVLASLFILAGINKMLNYAQTLQTMDQAGLSASQFLLPLVIALEFAGGCIVALGHRFLPIAAVSLALFTLATNLVFHRFWAISGPEGALELSLFFKNIAIVGALLYVGANGLKRTGP
jgi:putative oxidoreductase